MPQDKFIPIAATLYSVNGACTPPESNTLYIIPNAFEGFGGLKKRAICCRTSDNGKQIWQLSYSASGGFSYSFNSDEDIRKITLKSHNDLSDSENFLVFCSIISDDYPDDLPAVIEIGERLAIKKEQPDNNNWSN